MEMKLLVISIHTTAMETLKAFIQIDVLYTRYSRGVNLKWLFIISRLLILNYTSETA